MEQTLTELGYAGQPRVHTRAVVGAYLALRGEICHMLELKRQVRNVKHMQSRCLMLIVACWLYGMWYYRGFKDIGSKVLLLMSQHIKGGGVN